MPHGYCVLECQKRGYRTTIIDGKEVKVTFHKIPAADSNELCRKWLYTIRRDAGGVCCGVVTLPCHEKPYCLIDSYCSSVYR